jgi:hypothetical protein
MRINVKDFLVPTPYFFKENQSCMNFIFYATYQQQSFIFHNLVVLNVWKKI